MNAQMKFVKLTKVANVRGLGKHSCLMDVHTSKPFPSFETPTGVQFPALNVMSLIVVYSKAITFTFKNELAKRKEKD